MFIQEPPSDKSDKQQTSLTRKGENYTGFTLKRKYLAGSTLFLAGLNVRDPGRKIKTMLNLSDHKAYFLSIGDGIRYTPKHPVALWIKRMKTV
ncbi:hypothetical protein BG74_04560 [Sodalis-like endosymbiont of Proechinophthirus fluctus]|nr:hypothetical protein BG74_04560 [Sodalis-like endosymbiont of Proechinophthirus fluctus]